MKNLKKILSVLTLIVLVGSDFLTSISYALEDVLEDSEVVQIENEEETGSVGNEEKNLDEEDSEDVCEGENMGEEELETENSTRDVVEEGTGEVSEIGSGEIEELTEETLEGVTGDIVEELTGEIVESTGTGEETLIEEIKYNEELIIGEETYNDVTLRVEALTGIFPEGTELVIEPIKWWNLSNLKDKLVEEKEEIKEDTTIVAFDITFKYEGEEVQPKDGEKVKVIFDYSRNEDLVNADINENQEVKVYHIEDKDEEGNKVAQGEEKVVDVTNKQESEKNGIVVADAESFSIYAVTVNNVSYNIEYSDVYETKYIIGDDYNNRQSCSCSNSQDCETNCSHSFTYGTITIPVAGGDDIVIMDRNLGAASRWDGETAVTNSSDFIGYHYQWGNDYGFYPTITPVGNSSQVARGSGPYSSSTFIINNYLWNYDATTSDDWTQGPCPSGWHVPSSTEWQAVFTALNVGNDIDGFSKALLLPSAGNRYYYDGVDWMNIGDYNYWTSTPDPNNNDMAYHFESYNDVLHYQSSDGRSYGYSVRCFRGPVNEFVVTFEPNNGESTTTVQVEDGETIDSGEIPSVTKTDYNLAGWYTSTDGGQTLSDSAFDFDTPITGNITLYAKWSKNKRITDQMPDFTWGEISIPRPESISTGPDYYIIMDRNLGATSSGTVCDTGSNNGTCGLLYQFGNNYGFSYGDINMAEKCNEKSVDLRDYSPSNPYYDSTFIKGKRKCNNTGTDTDWAAISNYNIWGGQNGSYTDRQGPCPDEWHLPTQKEWEEAIDYWTVGESDQGTGVLNSSNIDNFRDYFQLPFAGGRSRSDGKISHVGAQGSYDTAQTNKGAPYILRITTTGGIVDSNTTYNQVNGYSIRCFKNIYEEEYYTVTFKNQDGDILRSGEVVAGETPFYSGSQPSRPATEQNIYSFNGWYPEITPVTSDVTYTATYTESLRLYTVTLTGTPAGYGTLTPESLTKEYGTTIVISGDKLTVGGTEVILTGNEGYEFQEWTGTCEKIEKQVCDEFTVYSHPEPIEFTGGNNLIISNPGYNLFSESNYQKDFEISFDIVEQDLSSSVSQATILNVKDEDQEDIWPGFVVRKSGTAGKIEISATSDYGEGFQTKSYSLENLHNMKISRINSILYVSINGEANQKIYDYSGFYNYFTKPIVFGSSYKDSNHLFRPAKITLSNILIKSVDTCYTGNVYVVTGDCQMTAKFKEIEEHPKVTVNHHWMNIGGSGYTIHETEYFSGNIGDEFTAIEKVYTGFTAKLNNDDTIIISGDNNSNVIDLYYDRHRGYFYFLIDPFNSAAITVSGCDNGTCWYGEDVQLTLQEETGYIFNSWGTPTSITLPEGLDRTQKTLSFTMPEINDMQIRWSVSLTAIPYTITYHLDGGEEVEHNQTEYTAGNFVIYVTDPIKTGYDFLGWTGGVINGSKLSGPTTGLVIVVNDMGNIEVGDREYYANWTPNKYEVTGSVAEGQENMGYFSGSTSTGLSLTGLYNLGTNLVVIAVPTLGYLFDYWEVNGSQELPEGATTGENQLNIIVNQILDIVAHFKPSNHTPYIVEHYKQNLGQTGYDFEWSGTMYGTTNASTNATGTDYEGFTLSGNLVDYQTGINADGSTVVRLYYDRNVYTITWNNWNGSGITTTPAVYGAHPEFARDGWPQRYRADDEVQYLFIFTGWSRSGSSEIIRELTGLITEIVTGDTTYIAQYDQTYRSFEVRYHPNGGTGNMENQTFQLYTSGALNSNNFIRTGYEFDGWLYYYADDATGFYENGQTINVEKDYVKGDRERELGLLYFDLYAQWKPSTDVKVTVNYYLKDLDADNNVLINSGTEYATGVEFTGTADSVVESILATYGTGIEGYEYSKSIVYGSDYPGGVETGTTTVLADGSRVIDMYYVPRIYQFTLNSESYSSTAGSSESTGYYYGAKVTLSGNSNDDCFTWSGWTTSGITLSDNTVKQTSFAMPANNVEVTPSTVENTYNIIFNGNESTSGNMSPMNGVGCRESTGLTLNAFEKSGHTFTGWSTTVGGIREYVDGETVDRLSTGADVNLYAVWDVNEYNVNASVATGDHGSLQWSGSGIYDFGETLVIIAVPELGYLFDYWEVNGSTELPEGATTGENQLTIVVNQILDIVAHFTVNEKTVTVNYYEMDTSGNYIYDPTHDYPNERYYYTGLVDSTFTVPDYSKTGFSFQYSIFKGNTGYDTSITFEVSENDSENIINVYYQRARNSLQIYSYNGSKYDVGPNCQSYDGGYTHSCSYYYGTEITINNYIYEYDEGYSFSGWNIDSEYSLPDDAYLSDEHIIFSMPDHSVIIRLETNHILYKLTFTGYEGAEVMNYDSTYVSLTGENYYRFDSEIELPYLDKPGYNFIGWNSGDYNEWSTYYSSNPNHPIRHMPSHDVELTAVFEPRTNMEYYKYYYFQDTEGSGYSLSGYDRYEDGITDQRVSSNCNYVEGFTHSRGEPDILYIKATGDNYINCYYDRDEYWVDVIYDNKELSITGTGKYRYDAPVNLVATANTGYEFSGFSSEWPEYNTTGSTLSFNVPLWGPASIYADANPIEYSIEYEMYGGWLYPYQRYITGYTVEDEMYFFDGAKDGYTFLGWTGGVIGERELTEPTKGLIIPSGSVGNRKYFANFEATGSNVTVNYYLKKIDPENNVLTGEVDEYISKGVVYTGLTDSVVDISALYGTGIEGYEYTTAIVYGSDSMSGIETDTTTILGDGTRSIDIYYTPKKYNFTVIQGQNTTTSGTSISTGYYFGAYVTLSGDSTEDCFGWNNWGSSDLPEGKNQQHTTFEMPAHNVTVESMVSEKSYNIVFDANGGTGTMSTLSVQCTTGTLSPNNFERNGYTFTGWSRNSGGPVEFTGGSNIHRLSTTSGGEVTLFAIWDFNEYTVTGTVAEGQENMGYLSGSTATGSSLTGLYDYGTELIFIAVPELGYLFDYWEVNGGTGDNLPDGVSISENQLTVVVDQILDIIAHFTENAKTVTVNYYEMNTGGVYPGVTNSTTFTGLVGHTGYATINIPYGFHLDTTQTTSTGIVISNNDSENVIDVYYARNQHQLNKFYTGDFQYNYNLVDFNPVLKQYYYYGEHIYTNVIAHTGYSVNNLTCSGGDNINIHGTEIEFDMGDKDSIIIIDGNKNRYRIDYYLDGGIENPSEPNMTGYTIIDGSIQIHDPIKTGYNFLGWTGGMSGDWISTPRSGLIIDVTNGLGDRQYYANWERKLYIVNVIIEPENGGTVGGTGEYYYGDRISLVETPNVSSGYQFTGWYTYEGYNKISDDYQIGLQADDSGGTGLIAKFELRNYLVHISSTPYKGSSRPQGDNYYQHGSLITVTAEPYEGYNVKNWMVNGRERKTGDNERYTGLTLDITITDPTNIDIDFEPKPYNITYMSGDTILTGLSPNTYDIETPICDVNFYNEYGTCMYYLPTLTRDGYDFTGWYNNPRISSYDRIEVLSGMGDKTIYAGFIPTTYKVYYHLGSGETLPGRYIDNYDEYTIESGRTYLPEPEKQGYDFLGWKDNNQIITGFGGGMTGNLDLYPVWTGKEMNIEVRYHEMDTNGQYPREWSSIYYTGVIDSTFNIPDYTSTGFSQDRINYPYQPSSIVVSGNDYANVVDVYYKRETYWLDTFGIKRLLPEIDSGVTFAEVIPNKQESGNQYYFGEEITVNLLFNDGWNFTGWYDATDEGMGFPPEEVSDLTVRNISFHMPAHDVKIEPLMEYIPYVLSFTGYEGADISEYYPGVEDQEIYFGYHAYLPYLNKSGYWFNGWKDEYGNYEWRTGEPYPSEPILQKMPSHDYELIADFSPRTDMGYAEYYYLQDIEGSGYSLSGDLTTWWLDGVTEQLIPKRYPTVTGFDLPRYWIDGQDLPYDSLGPVINATGENFINYYYDRLTYLIDVDYDSSKMLITGTGEYRYDAPVVLTATVKTGYEFSGFVSENPEYNTTGSTLSFNVPYNFVSGYPPIIHAYANPIVYSIDYEMNGGYFVPYNWAKTGYTVDGDFDLDIFDAGKEGYTFLGWTGGVIGVRELTEPTTGLIIPLGSIGNRKYFANFEATGSNVTVNYYLKKIDSENNVLTGGIDEYLMGIIYTGLTDTVVDIHALYGTGIEGYEYTTAIVYGSDFTDGLETDTTTILGDGSRVIDIYYTPKKYNFTVIQGQNSTTSGTSISTGYYFGAYVTLSGDSKDNCFEWDKWGSQTLPAGKNQQHTTFEMPAHNVTVESMVKEKSYNIIFNANGGTGTMSTLSVQCTTGTLSPNNFEKDGYTFTGWSRNSGGPVEFTGGSNIHRLSTTSGGEVTLFAIWDINWYTVIFDLNGGSLTGDMTLTTGYTIETPAISLENYIPIKTGYNFSGWYKDNDLVNSIAGGGTGNYTLIAKWEAIPFTVSFDTASGTVVESQIYYYNDVLSGLDNAITTKTGYNFSGWYLGDVLYTAVSKMPAKNIILTAKWTPRTGVQYQVNHRGENTGNNNYTTLLSSYKMYGTSDSQTVAESGNFAGFSLSGNVNQKIIKPDGTTVVDIYYNRNVYSVMLDNNGGTGVIELTGKYQAPLIVPNPSKSGYEFVGWDPELPTTIPSYNYTGIAMWNPSTGEYKVEFYYQLSDGTYPSVATSGVIRTGMTEGTGSVTAVDKNPTMSGYSFDSTNTENVLEGEIVGDGSLILKVYFKKQFTVKYLTGSQGTFPIDIHSDLDYGTGTPVFRGNTGSHNPGYTFSGWNPELKEIVTGNMTYEAQWKADLDTLYSVEYYKENLSGGYDIWTGMYTGETDTEVTALIRDFTGFTYSGGNQNNITSGVIAGDGSLVLKLFYDRNKYTITWKDGNNETLKTEQIFYGAIPVYSGAIPTKTATAQYTYTFNDTWSPNIEPVTTGAIYSAQFDTTVNKYLITFKDGDGNVIQSGVVAYGDTPIYTGATPTKTATAQYSYTFNNTRSPSIEFVTTGVSYIAQFDSSVNSYSVNIVSSNTDMGTISTGKINVEYGSNIVESGNKITIGGVEIVATPNLADVQYTYEFDNRTNTCGLELVGTCTIQANFKKTLNKYTITWKDDNGNVIDTTMVEYGIIPTHAKPTKAETEDYRYVFAGWTPNLVAVVGDAEYTAVFVAEEKPSKGGNTSGGGGRKSNVDDIDEQYGSGEEKSDGFTGDITTGDVNDETLSLYEWARQNNITTMNTLEEANPDGLLTRGHMAKMVINFAQNVLGRTIPTTYPDKCNWKDKESDRESPEIKEYAKKACALGLMGIYVEEFMPNKILDRAEFGTVISRLLWGNKYNVTDTYHRSYYEDHLRLLKKNGILTQINEAEDRWEIRKWVWLVFRRIEEKLKNKGE